MQFTKRHSSTFKSHTCTFSINLKSCSNLRLLKSFLPFWGLMLEDRSDQFDRWSCQVSKDMLVYSRIFPHNKVYVSRVLCDFRWYVTFSDQHCVLI